MNPILVVDDNAQIVDILSQYIKKEGWPMLAAKTGEEALALFDAAEPSLILLDIMLPGLDGLEVCRRIRRVSSVPILMITAKDEDADRILGLDIGADDYIVKPFAPTELVARVESVLRRAGRSTAVYTMWEYTVDAAACRVLRGEEEMHLTRKEYDLLLLFLRNRGRALYRDYLYETVWGDDGTGCDTRTLDTHIARLRRKLNLGDRLRSVRQIGYMLEKE